MAIEMIRVTLDDLSRWLLAACVLLAGCRPDADSPSIPETSKSVEPQVSTVRPNRAPKSKPAGTLPSFRMVSRESGFDFERYDDIGNTHRILEANGGGVALFDLDHDGWLDVFMTNGCRLPLKLDDRQSHGDLFRNLSVMQFEDVTDSSKLVQFGYTHGCAVGDYDADGFDDLYVTALGPDTLWHNNGDGTFTDATSILDTDVPEWGSSAAFADINQDGHLDLYVANYVHESDENPKLCPNSRSPDGYEQCPPAMFRAADDVLFLSDGAGRFIDATAAAGLANTAGNGLGVVISDLDRDSHPEIYVANDGEPNFLFVPVSEQSAAAQSESAGESLLTPHFVERGMASGVALNEAGIAQASMGVAAGDYDANGTLDLYLTNFFGDTSTLYANHGELRFEDVTRNSNLRAPSRDRLGFGTTFVDVDNDGWLDLFVANGHVDDRTWLSQGEPYRMKPQIYRNERDRTFADVSDWSGEYFRVEWLGRGVSCGDLDHDGRVDLVVSHQLAPSMILKNETVIEHQALVLRFVGTSSNRNGIGVRIEVIDREPVIFRELIGGGSYQSALAPEIHVGLGDHTTATVRVHWPSGTVETYSNLAAGRWTAVEGYGVY